MKLSVDQAAAITSLLKNPEFTVFMHMVSDIAEKSMMVLIKSNENIEQNQGECRALTGILEAVDSAPGTLEQYQNSK